jgi:tetratricopeptide (TPR) repeat protein
VIFSILLFHFTSLAQNCRTDIDSGDIYYKKFNNTKAYEFYSKALKTCGGYEALYKTTRTLNDLGEEKSGNEAAKFYQMALSYSDTLQKMFPDSVQSWFLNAAAAGNLAIYKHGVTQIELAREVYKSATKAIEIDSTFAQAHVILGSYYRDVALAGSLKMKLARAMYGAIPGGTLNDSKRELEKAVELDYKNIFAHLELAKTYYALKDNQNARKQLNIVLSLPDLISQSSKVKKEAKQLLISFRD